MLYFKSLKPDGTFNFVEVDDSIYTVQQMITDHFLATGYAVGDKEGYDAQMAPSIAADATGVETAPVAEESAPALEAEIVA